MEKKMKPEKYSLVRMAKQHLEQADNEIEYAERQVVQYKGALTDANKTLKAKKAARKFIADSLEDLKDNGFA